MRLTLRYGNEKSLADTRINDATTMLPSLWTRGTGKDSFQELQDKVNNLKGSLSAGGGAGSVTFNLSARKKTFGDLLRLFKDVLRDPALKEEDFKVLQNQNLTQLQSMKSDPRMLGQVALMRRLKQFPKDNIRYVPTVEESIERAKAVTVEDVRNVYKKFLGGNIGELTIVGAFDKEEALGLIEDALDGWTSKVPYERIKDLYQKPKGEVLSIETPDKKMAVFYAGTNIEVRDDDPDWEAMFIGNNILGGGALANRLGERVRQKEGLSYGIGSMFQAGSMDKSGLFLTQAITNPKNRDKLLQVVDEEYDKILNGGVSPDELEKAKSAYIKQLNGVLGKENQLLGILHRFRRLDRDPEFLQRRFGNVSKLTKKQVDAAIKKMLDGKNLIIVTAGDFEGTKPSSDDDKK